MSKKFMFAATLGFMAALTACSSNPDSSVSEVSVTEEPVTEVTTELVTSSVSESAAELVTTVEKVTIEIEPDVYDLLKHVAGNYITFSIEDQAKIMACIITQAENNGGNIYDVIRDKNIDITSIYYGDEHTNYSDLSEAVNYYCDNRSTFDCTDYEIKDNEVIFK